MSVVKLIMLIYSLVFGLFFSCVLVLVGQLPIYEVSDGHATWHFLSRKRAERVAEITDALRQAEETNVECKKLMDELKARI